MTYDVVIQDLNDVGASIIANVRVGSEEVARIEMMFAYLRDAEGALGLPDNMFPPEDLMVMLRLFRLFEVARDVNGNPRPVPPWLLDAEQRSVCHPSRLNFVAARRRVPRASGVMYLRSALRLWSSIDETPRCCHRDGLHQSVGA